MTSLANLCDHLIENVKVSDKRTARVARARVARARARVRVAIASSRGQFGGNKAVLGQGQSRKPRTEPRPKHQTTVDLKMVKQELELIDI